MWIRNPAEWGAAQIAATGHAMRSLGHALAHPDIDSDSVTPGVNRISFADLREALAKGFDDFLAFRDDVLFICLIYPVAGFIIAEATSNAGLLPLIFPLFAGFALIGPFAAVWLYEMSRRREHGEDASWIEAFRSFSSPATAAIFKLGLLLIGIFALWLFTAMRIYALTVGPEMPTSFTSMVHDVFTTSAGWALIVTGVGTGFLFALAVLSISVISFPLLLDRRVSVGTAIATSIRAMRASPGPLLAWGFIVAAALVVGMIPAMIGLVVALPVLGHATWHLYRKVVA
jgi:uncharacterized membrane protein